MNLIHKYFRSSDGLRIFYRKDVPYNPKAIIIISHGYGEHSGHYLELSELLIKNGYGVYLIDNRSHGRSEGTRGHIESFFKFTVDFNRLFLIVKRNHPNSKIFTFGHSMGGLITFIYGLIYPEVELRGQIFSGPALGAPWGLYGASLKLCNVLGKTIPKGRIYRIGRRRATRNIQYSKEFKKDFYDLRYSTIGLIREFLYKGISWAQENAEHYDLPCLFLHGKCDKVIPYERTTEVYHRIQSEDKTLKFYENCYHELVHEPEKEEIMSDILCWLEKRIN